MKLTLVFALVTLPFTLILSEKGKQYDQVNILKNL